MYSAGIEQLLSQVQLAGKHFPGGPEGPNEQFADVMVDTLDLGTERRANKVTRCSCLACRGHGKPQITSPTNGFLSPIKNNGNQPPCAGILCPHAQWYAKREGVDDDSSAHRNPQSGPGQALLGRTTRMRSQSFSSHSLGLTLISG